MLRRSRGLPPALAAVLILAAPFAATAAPHLVRTLPSKITVVARENRTRPLVAIQAWVKSGTRDETVQDRGVATVVSRTLPQATRKRPPGEFLKDLTMHGASFDVEVGPAYTAYQITVPARYFGFGLDALADMLVHPRMSAEDLTQGTAQARSEARAVLSAAERATVPRATEILHPGNALGIPSTLPELELAGITMPLARRFYERHYVAENLMVVVVGDIEPDEAARRIEAAFQEMPRGKVPSRPKISEKPLSGPKIMLESNPQDTQGSAFTVGFRAPAWGTADAFALDVLMALLVDSPTSRAQKRLAEADENSPFELAAAQRSVQPEGGTVAISLRAKPEDMKDAETVLLSMLEQARSTPVTQDELRAATYTVLSREMFQRSELKGLARTTAIAVLQGRPGADEVWVERLRAIRPEDLTAVANRYLDLKQAAIVEMMPRSTVDSLGLREDFERRIKEKLTLNEAASRQGPRVSQSEERERRERIDAPLARIPSAPLDAGRALVEKTTLPGGTRLLTSEDRSAPLVTVGVYLAGGVRYENEKTNGVTSLLRETLLTTSDPKAGDLAYRFSLPQLGGLVPYQDRDMWGFSLSVPAESWREALTRLGAMLAHPEMDTVTVDATRIHVLNILDQWLEDDAAQRARLIFPTRYEVSGYRLPGLGTRKNLITMPLGTVEDWYRTFVTRENLVITVFGDIRPGEVPRVVEEAFADVSSKPFRPPALAKELPFEGFREKWELGGGPEATVTLAYSGPPATSPDVAAMYVANSLLSGPRGWFQQYLDSNPALIRASSSVVSHALDESPIIASITVAAPIQEESAVKLLFRQFKKVAYLPLTGELADTLVYAKTHAAGSYLSTLGTNTSRAFQWARAELFGLGVHYPLALPARIDAVTADDLNRIGLKYFEKDEFTHRPYAIAETRPGGW